MRQLDQIVTCYCYKCDFQQVVEHPGQGPAKCPDCGAEGMGCSIFTVMDPGPQFKPSEHIVIKGTND